MRFPTITAKELIKIVKDRFVDHEVRVASNKKAFTYEVIEESENYILDLKEIEELAKFLDIPFAPSPPPYEHWIPGFSNHLTCLQYVNPKDPKDYILLVQVDGKSGDMEALHHKAGKFKDWEVFQKLIPFTIDLPGLKENFANDVKQKHPDIRQKTPEEQGRLIRGSFTRNVIKPIEEERKKADTNLDPFILRLIYTFFEICVPEVDGICPKCFQVSFPDSGFGISYEKKMADNLKYEVRLSPKKLGGYPQQKEIYITNTMNVTGTVVHVKWRSLKSSEFTFTRDIREEITHLPYKSTDQQKLRDYLASESARIEIRQLSKNKTPNLVLPICQCHQTT